MAKADVGMAQEPVLRPHAIETKVGDNEVGEKATSNRRSSGFSFFGWSKVEEPKEEDPRDVPEVSSEVCGLIIRDINDILSDSTRKAPSLVKVLKEAQVLPRVCLRVFKFLVAWCLPCARKRRHRAHMRSRQGMLSQESVAGESGGGGKEIARRIGQGWPAVARGSAQGRCAGGGA